MTGKPHTAKSESGQQCSAHTGSYQGNGVSWGAFWRLAADVIVGKSLDTETPVFMENMQYLEFRYGHDKLLEGALRAGEPYAP